MYKTYGKPFLDCCLALIGFILLFPIFLIVWIALYIANQGKPFFFQKRPGKNERIFKVIKFKTMNDKKDQEGNLLPDAVRLTAAGKFVRKTSLDEIPQLLNVIKGEMSLVGPRPLLMKYLPYYSARERKRFDIRPGITGWAQVNGRNKSNWDIRLANDVYYVENLSFKLDMQIIFLTIKNILISENVVLDPRSIMLDLDDERKERL